MGKPGQMSLWVVDMPGRVKERSNSWKPGRFLPMEGVGMPGPRSLRGAVVGMSEGTWDLP